MSYSIPSSTKILTLATVPFLFILICILSICEFAMVPRVYILLSLQVLCLGCGWLLISLHKWLYVTSFLSMSMNKNLSAKTTKYILKCWEMLKKKSNLNFIRVITFFGDDFLFPTQYISLLAVQLYCVTYKKTDFVNVNIL